MSNIGQRSRLWCIQKLRLLGEAIFYSNRGLFLQYHMTFPYPYTTFPALHLFQTFQKYQLATCLSLEKKVKV